jgi:NADH dehydrogenase
VTACDDQGVMVGEERVQARVVLWGAGVAASPAAKWLGAERDRAGRGKSLDLGAVICGNADTWAVAGSHGRGAGVQLPRPSVLRVCARRTYRCAAAALACSHMKRGRVCQTQR